VNIELPFPAKILWPNGRGHWAAKSRETRKHREWAFYVTVGACGPAAREGSTERISWSATFFPKAATRRAIDKDNAVASLKAYQDGIASALGIDDSLFDPPTIHFAEPVKNGRVVIVLDGV
jgi:crossover junction endodeoxyribonuclease RusA